MNKIKILIEIFLLFFCLSGIMSQQKIFLQGKWKVKLDKECKLKVEDVVGANFDKIVKLPGTTDIFNLGTELNTDTIKKPYIHLFRKHSFIGKAWYYKEVKIPKNWSGKIVKLKLEMVKWISQLFVDGQEVGTQNSLVTPHYFDVTKFITPGKHIICIAVDNTKHFDVGLSSAYTEETQTIWNGILGDIYLVASNSVSITQVTTYPNIKTNSVQLSLKIRNYNKKNIKSSILIKAIVGKHKVNVLTINKNIKIGESTLELNYSLGNKKYLWSEFTPNVYRLTASISIERGGKKVTNSYQTNFGMRNIVSDGHSLRLNGNKIFLRGTLDCSIYPKTGYPPTGLGDWLKIMNTIKNYGMNHIRYHSWCPPAAAFDAADKLGIYMQVELPSWSFNVGQDDITNKFLNDEAHRIIKEYGNHPSFCFLTLGNELEGNFDYMNNMIMDLRKLDSRHLYTVSTFTFQRGHGRWSEPSDQYLITQITKKGWVRGQGFFNKFSPNSKADYRKSIEGLTIPLISHEVGQYSVYPRIAELNKYDGVLYPFSLITIKKDLRSKGLLGQAADFTLASGKLAELLYKEEIERALRTPNQAGFQLLQLTDFPGQSTADVGLLDAFWESKGITTAKSFRKFCSQSVLLFRTEHFVYENDEHFKGSVEFANYSSSIFKSVTANWELKDSKGTIYKKGSFINNRVGQGEYFTFGDIDVDLSFLNKATNLKLVVNIDGTDIINDWNIWVYPKKAKVFPKSNNVVVSNDLEETIKALRNGKKVIYNPSPICMRKKVSGNFVPVFWSPVHFPKQAGTMGILCNPKHAAFANFPTDFYTNWQWWDLTHNMSVLDISSVKTNISPIVQVIDNFARNAKLAGIMEAKVAKGSLIISSFDISNNLDKRPVARQMLRSLKIYASSDKFSPTDSLTEKDLNSLFMSKIP